MTSSTTIVDTCVTYDSTATFRYLRIYNDGTAPIHNNTMIIGEFELYVGGLNVCRDSNHGYSNLSMTTQSGSNTDTHKSNAVNGGTYYGAHTGITPGCLLYTSDAADE